MTADGYATEFEQLAADAADKAMSVVAALAQCPEPALRVVRAIVAEQDRLRAEVAALRAELAAERGRAVRLAEARAKWLRGYAKQWSGGMATKLEHEAMIADNIADAIRNGTPAPPLVDEQEGE